MSEEMMQQPPTMWTEEDLEQFLEDLQERLEELKKTH